MKISSYPTFILLSFITLACKGAFTDPHSTGRVILMQSSFEANGQPTLDPWMRVDSLQIATMFFSTDVSPNGGQWSLGVKSPGVMEPILSYSVPSRQLVHARTFRLIYWMKSPSFTPPNILWSLEVASVGEYWLSTGHGDHFFDSNIWRADTIELTSRYPVINVTVSMGLWPTTDRDTTKYILFDAVTLEAQ